MFNFLSAITCILGVIAGYFLSAGVEGSINFLPGFAAGGFIYIAVVDLIPELKKDKKAIVFVVLGILLM